MSPSRSARPFRRWRCSFSCGGGCHGLPLHSLADCSTDFHRFFITNLTDAHFFLGMAVVPPLVVACLDELLVRQRNRPVDDRDHSGTPHHSAVLPEHRGLVDHGDHGSRRPCPRSRLRLLEAFRNRPRTRATMPLSVCFPAIVTAGVLLAYPAWFALAGPAHLSGRVWSFLDLKAGGNSFNHLFVPESPAAVRAGLGITSFGLSHATGGYQGAVLSPQYFGLGVFAVVVAGLLIWRHDRRLWLFGGLSCRLAGPVIRGSQGQFGPMAGAGLPARVRQHHSEPVHPHYLPICRRDVGTDRRAHLSLRQTTT